MASEYQLTSNPRTVLRVADQAFIPDDPANRDFQRYLQFLDDGGVPDPAPLIPPPTSIASVEFLARFMPDELLLIESASHTDADINYGLHITAAASQIELAPQSRNAALVFWIDLLVWANCITAARKDEIMRLPEPATPLPAWEAHA